MMCLTFKTVFSSHRTAYRRSDITWETRWARYHPLTHSSLIYSITLLKKCFCTPTTAEINVLSDDSLRNTSQCVKQLWNVLIKDLQCQTHVSKIQKLWISSSSSNDINPGQTQVNGWTFTLSLSLSVSVRHCILSTKIPIDDAHVPTDLPQVLLEVCPPRETGLKVWLWHGGRVRKHNERRKHRDPCERPADEKLETEEEKAACVNVYSRKPTRVLIFLWFKWVYSD